jgi:hypothetical protein
VTTGAAARFGVIVRSAGLLLAADATVARASRDDAAADSGRGVSLDLFFLDSRCTCWTRIQSAASESEYPFALIGGDGESRDRVWLTGQEEEGRLLGAGINLVFLPF